MQNAAAAELHQVDGLARSSRVLAVLDEHGAGDGEAVEHAVAGSQAAARLEGGAHLDGPVILVEDENKGFGYRDGHGRSGF